jgi:hypothetical protein
MFKPPPDDPVLAKKIFKMVSLGLPWHIIARELQTVIGRFKTSHRWALQNQPGEVGLSIVSGAVPGTFTRS